MSENEERCIEFHLFPIPVKFCLKLDNDIENISEKMRDINEKFLNSAFNELKSNASLLLVNSNVEGYYTIELDLDIKIKEGYRSGENYE